MKAIAVYPGKASLVFEAIYQEMMKTLTEVKGAIKAFVNVGLIDAAEMNLPSVFPVPKVQDAFDENGKPSDPKWDRRVDRFLGELEWYARALKEARDRDGKNAGRSLCEAASLKS